MPKIPKLEFREELETLNEIQFIQQVNEIIRLEQQMKSYFYLAPFSGTFTPEQHLKNGEVVKAKELVGTIVQTKKVRVHVSKKDWELCNNHSNPIWTDGQIQLSDWIKRQSQQPDSLVFEAQSSDQIPVKRNWIPIQ